MDVHNNLFLSEDETRAFEYLGDQLRQAPQEITVSDMTRALLFWAAKLRLQYKIADPYPVSLSLKNFKPHRHDVGVELEAAQASTEMIRMIDEIRIASVAAPDSEKPDGPEMTLSELDELIRKQIMGDLK